MGSTDGLVFAYLLDGKGGGAAINWQDIEGAMKKGQDTLWLHLDYMNEKARRWLFEKSGLDRITCGAIVEEETRPRFAPSDGGLMLILRGINCNPGADPEDMVSLRMWLGERLIITLRHRKVMAVDDLRAAL